MKWYILGIGFLIIGASQSFAQGKIGYVNSQQIFAELPEFQEAQKKFDKEVEDWNSRATVMNQEIDSIKTEQTKNSLIWSSTKRTEIEALLKSKQDSLQQYLNDTFGPNGKADTRMSELSKPINDKIIAVVKRVAIEKDFDMVLDVATVSIAYAKESLNLTDEVLAEMAKEK